MKKNKSKGNFLVGLIAILPIIVVYEVIDFVPDWIYNPIKDVLGSSEFVSKILGLCFISVVLWVIGAVINSEVGVRLKKWLASVIRKIPIMGYLFQVVAQMLNTIRYTNSFKEVVIIPIGEKFFVFAYVSYEAFGYLWIHAPSLPAPWTSPLPTVVAASSVIRTKISISKFFSSIITLGMSSSTEDIIKELKERLKELREGVDYVVESYSDSEGDSSLFNGNSV